MFFIICKNVSAPPNKRKTRAQDKNTIFKINLLLNHWSKLKFYRIAPHISLYQNCTNGLALLNKIATRANHRTIFNHLLKHWPKFKIVSQKCSSLCPLPNNTNCSAPLNKMSTSAKIEKKDLLTSSPEPLTQIHNTFTQMFPKMPSFKILLPEPNIVF